MTEVGLPDWVVLHIPHDSTDVPEAVKGQFIVTCAELELELLRMTDHFTLELFASPTGAATVVRAPVSRLVVDVERFPNDDQEPMASRGMGVIYQTSSHLSPIRRAISLEERDVLLHDWYFPHHRRLEDAVTEAVNRHGRCLVIDCHSFPGIALPYEQADPSVRRPDICIGSDRFHTPSELEEAFIRSFASTGWSVSVNSPFSGALVPQSRYQRDRRVHAVMVEVNRNLYLNPSTFDRNPEFSRIAWLVQSCCSAAAAAYASRL